MLQRFSCTSLLLKPTWYYSLSSTRGFEHCRNSRFSCTPLSFKSTWYYSLSSTRSFEHCSNSISNNCQKISSRARSETKISENKGTNSILEN